MPELPPVGTRVSLRYRLPAGSVPPLTDVVGHLLEVGPVLRVRTKRDDVVDVAAADVVAIKALTAAPVRTGDIRNLEYAAAMAWPGIEQQWIDGWLLRYGHGSTRRANSAVPLEVRGGLSACPRSSTGTRPAASRRCCPCPTGCSGCHRACLPTARTW